MVRTPADDRAYFLKRSADHRRLADRAEQASSRLAHERFAATYAQRAADIVVEHD